MILVTGATGQLGTAVVHRLLEKTDATDVAVLARDEGKAADLARRGVAVRLGDYDDSESLDRAVAGVDRVLLIAGNDPQHRVQQHQNVIDASVRAGVGLLGFASRSLRDVHASENTLMGAYFETEDRIQRSGLNHVIFRNALYMDAVTFYVGGPRVFDSGRFALPAGDGKVAYALRREMGEALANAMLDHTGGNRSYLVASPHAYGFDDVAAALTELSGKAINYSQVTDEEYVASAVRDGTPEYVARHIVGFCSDIREQQLDETSTDLQSLLGREPATLVKGLHELFEL